MLKKLKVPADGFVQAAFQQAYRRTHGTSAMPSVYEPASMRHFHDARTETIRCVVHVAA
jgi:hypothetical protein